MVIKTKGKRADNMIVKDPVAIKIAFGENPKRLDEKNALWAMTKNPAEILGVSDRVSTLESGKDADVAVFDGHPLDIQSKTKYVIINGEVVFQG